MPRAFDITAAMESVNLNASGQGELAFTVSNALRTPMRARAVVMMAGPARPEWASVSGGAERDFAPDGTQQFTVKFQVPAGTPAGRYTCVGRNCIPINRLPRVNEEIIQRPGRGVILIPRKE
jgi:hypothetical protein